jgi:hypothetical protein
VEFLRPSLEQEKPQMKSKILPFCDKNLQGDALAYSMEVRSLVVLTIGPVDAGEPLKTILARFARRMRISSRRAETFWRGTALPSAPELDRLRALAAANIEENHAEHFDRHACRLEAVDPDFYRPEIARLRGQAKRLRDLAD